jgi:methionyl aminopeptidase
VEAYVPLKTAEEVAGIRRSCRLAASVLRQLLRRIREGVTTLELDRLAAALLERQGASAGVSDRFPGTICASVGDVAAHGVPSARALRGGEIVTVDLAVLYAGWYGDTAVSVPVPPWGEGAHRLVAAAGAALEAAVQAASAGSRLGDVGAAVQAAAARWGARVLVELVGHGIGRELHEEPEVPHAGSPGQGARIVPGMVFTVEPALTFGSGRLRQGRDGFSFETEDGQPVAQFEHTLAVFKDHTEVLTAL